jgi:hypothetical protein
MSQHDGNIGNGAGAVVRADINAALEAILTNNSGATEPAAPYANMWWYDTSTSLLKRRNNANDAWIVLGLEAADTDGTLAANSDSKVATQKATKTYVDAKTIAENRLSISDNTTANASTSAHGFLKKLSNVATEFMNGVGNWVAVTIDGLLPSQTDNSGKFLTTNGSVSSWGSVSLSGLSNLVYSWIGCDRGIGGQNAGMFSGAIALNHSAGGGLYQNVFLISRNSTAFELLYGVFTKTASISTITINARLWSDNSNSSREAILTVNVGGQTNTVKSVTSTTPAWVTQSTIDVSSLTNGTTYNIVISLHNESADYNAYCSAVMLIGS